MPKIITDPEQKILDASEAIVLNQGLEVLNIREIAKTCHMAAGTIYNYFPNKESIIERLMVRHWDSFLSVVDRYIIDEQDLLIKIESLFSEYSRYISDFHSIFFSKQTFTLEKKHPENSLKNDYMRRLLQKISQLLNNSPYVTQCALSSEAFADFILANFMALSTFHHYKYESFEIALKKLLDL